MLNYVDKKYVILARLHLCFLDEHFILLSPSVDLLSSPVENQNDLELDFKVFFFVDSCC